MRVRRDDLFWLVPLAVVGWLVAGVLGAVVAAVGGLVGLRWPRLVAAYAAVVLAVAGVATLLEGPVGNDDATMVLFVRLRPVAGALGLGAGVLLAAAVVSGIRAERPVEPPGPATDDGTGGVAVRRPVRPVLPGATVAAVAAAAVLAVLETPAVRLLAPVLLLAVGIAWVVEARRQP